MTDIVEIPEPSDSVVSAYSSGVNTLTFDELMEMESYTTLGFTPLEKEEMKGVPHIITRVTYWVPKKDQRGFVSVEATIAGPTHLESAHKRGWISEGQTNVEPNERVVYNDGGTGIRRQLTKMFHELGLLNVGGSADDGDARFDRAWPEWESFSQSREQGEHTVPSFDTNHNGNPLIIKQLRGLHVSEYSNEYSDEGVTWYLR